MASMRERRCRRLRYRFTKGDQVFEVDVAVGPPSAWRETAESESRKWESALVDGRIVAIRLTLTPELARFCTDEDRIARAEGWD